MPTVLVVEDTPLNLKLFRILLEHAGHTVLSAIDGRVALQMLETAQPDVVLMDVQLPEIDGLEVTRRLRANHLTAHIPIAVVTGYASAADELAARDAGADAFLPKQTNNALLLEVVQRLATEGRPSDE